MGARLRGRSALCGDVGREACGLELGRAGGRVCFLGECAYLHLVVAVALYEVGVEACGLDLVPLGFGVGKVLECTGLHAVERLGLLLRLRLGGVRRAEALVDLGGDFSVPAVEVGARAALVRVVAVDGHVAAVEVVHALVLVRRPDELFDAVPLADVGHEVEHRGVGFLGNGVGLFVVAGDFDCDGPVVVHSARGTPRAVALVHAEADAAVVADDVVAGRFLACRLKYLAAALCRYLRNETMDGDGVDFVITRAVFVRADEGIVRERAVAHSGVLLSTSPRLSRALRCLRWLEIRC